MVVQITDFCRFTDYEFQVFICKSVLISYLNNQLI